MLEISHVVPSFGFGGAERVTIAVANALNQHGDRVRLVIPGGGAAARGIASEFSGIIKEVPAKNPDRPNRRDAARFALTAFFLLRRADVVHMHLPWPDRIGMAVIARGCRPAVFTFHLLPPELESSGHDLLFGAHSPSHGHLLRASARLAPLVLVGLTRSDCSRLRCAFPGLPVEQVSNAPLAPAGAAPEPVRFGPGLRLLAAGRLEPQKGFDDLLRALATEPMRSRIWTLCIIGEGPERPRLESLAVDLGISERIQLVGALSVVHVLPQAELFVTSSRYEGMPLILLEALHAGLPVVASRIPAHEEILEGIEDALLAADRGRWSEALAGLVDDEDLRRILAAQARTRAGHYTLERQLNAYSALYQRVITQDKS